MSANPPASFEGDERVRLFCALQLPEQTLDGLLAWQREAFSAVPRVRPVPRENLHVTLAFLGHRPAAELEAIVGALRAASARAERPRLSVRGYRETRSVGMLTFDDDDDRAAALAEDLHERLEALGVYRREDRPWLAHLTVLRFRDRPRLRPPLPELGEVVPSDAAVYLSELGPKGAQYFAVESFVLGERVR